MARPFCLVRPRSVIVTRNRPTTGHFKPASYGEAILSCPAAFCHCHAKPAYHRTFQTGFLWRGHFVLSSRVLLLSRETGLPPDISKRLRHSSAAPRKRGPVVDGEGVLGFPLPAFLGSTVPQSPGRASTCPRSQAHQRGLPDPQQLVRRQLSSGSA